MVNIIEKMNRMRRNVLIGMLIGTVITFVLFMLANLNLYKYSYRSAEKVTGEALIVWLLTLLILGTIYWLYKRKLRNAPSLRAAVNDERIRLSRLKAYRFAFFSSVIITIIWKLCETYYTQELISLKMHLPDGPWLILYVAVISMVGSFLYYNKEAKNG